MGSHSFLAASSAHIWAPAKGCRAFPTVAMLYPQDDDCDESAEGTAAHHVAAVAAERATRADSSITDQLGTTAPNGWVIDDDMLDGARTYARAVQSVMQRTCVFTPWIEQRLEMPSVHEANGGTPDAALWAPLLRELHVFDYKYGFGVVQAFENWQLMNYAVGMIDRLGVDGALDQSVTVYLHVIQPRAPHPEGPVRVWQLLGSDLRAYRNTMRQSAEECFEPNAVARTGGHCRYCPGRHRCDALQRDAAAAADYESRTFPMHRTAAEMAVELTILDDALSRLSDRSAALREELDAALRGGQYAPGWCLEPGQSRLKWTAEIDAVYALGDAVEIDLRKVTPRTPTQAIDLGVPETLVKQYATRPPGALKLARDTGAKARKIFGGNTP